MNSNTQSTARAEIGICLFLIVICAVVLWESRKIPPGTFEPLGSAPIPQAIAVIIAALCVLTTVRAVSSLRDSRLAPTTADNQPHDSTAHESQPKGAVAILLLTAIYCLVLQSEAVSFALATVVFLFLTIGLLLRFRPRSMIAVCVIAAVMGFGCQYVFTQVFVVDLPGAF